MKKMMKLYNLLPIDVWLGIALCVQKFSINNASDNEKLKNYKMLEKYLQQKSIEFDSESLSSLIDNIYNLECDTNYKKAYFMEQICALKDIGVLSLAYMPNNFLKNVIKLTDKNEKSIILKSAYTNGTFNIRKWEDIGYKYYSILNLEQANYVIIKTMYIDENRLAKVEAYLKDFNGYYPDKKEIKRFKQASLLKRKKNLYQEKYNLLSRDKISCKSKMELKLGKKQKNNQYYYE